MSRPDPDTELAMLVRDAAPRPSAEFLEGLDGRAGERFRKPERERRAWLSWPRLVPAPRAGALAVPGGAIAVGSREDGVTPLSGKAQTEQARPSTAGGDAARAPKPTAAEPVLPDAARSSAGTAAPAPAVAVPVTPHRKVIRDTQL